MRRIVCAAALVCGCMLFGAAEGSPKRLPSREKTARSPLSVLVESYQLSRELVPSEQAMLLNFLCRTAGEHHLRVTASWAEENFRVARQLPPDWNQVAFEKNALVALSYVNPNRAMTLLRVADLPVAEVNGSFAEDVRSDGAVTIFKNLFLLKGTGALASIRQTAAYLGQTGQYPYFAVQGIVLEVASRAKKHSAELPVQAASFVPDAYSSYRRGSKFESEDDDFVHFLQALRPVLSEALFKEGLETAVDRLLNEDSTTDPRFPYVARIGTEENGLATFDKRQDAILFGLLPLVREVDPAWAARIVERNQVLAQAAGNSGKVISSEAAIVTSKPEQQSYVSDYLRVQSINELAQKNPDEAWRLRLTIDNLALRASAMANVATVLASSAPDRAKEIENAIASTVPNIKDANDRLSALSALAKAAAAAKDSVRFRDVLNKSFTLGEELYEEDVVAHPGKPTYGVAAYNVLSDIVSSGTGIDPRATLSRIDQVENVALKAYLLSSYAEAAYKRGDLSKG